MVKDKLGDILQVKEEYYGRLSRTKMILVIEIMKLQHKWGHIASKSKPLISIWENFVRTNIFQDEPIGMKLLLMGDDIWSGRWEIFNFSHANL